MNSDDGKVKVRCPFCGNNMRTGVKKDKVTCSGCSNKFWKKENLVKEST